MKKLIVIIGFLVSMIGFSQGGPKVDVIKYRDVVTTTIRNTFDVPAGEIWVIWNETTTQLEIAQEDDVWSAIGGGSFLALTGGTMTGEIQQNLGGGGPLSTYFGTVAGLNDDATQNGNAGFGHGALQTVTEGFRNTAMGYLALNSVLTGDYNTSFGDSALEGVSSGSQNTSIGSGSLENISNSSNNIAIGVSAGQTITGGATPLNIASAGIFIGNSTRASADTSINEMVIGHFVTGNGNNTVTIGDASVTDNYFSGNIHGAIASSLVTYDNTASGLDAANVKVALDSIVDKYIIVHPDSPNDAESIYIGTTTEISLAGLASNVIAIPTDALASLTVADIDTSAELAAILTDETGTGLAVFGTSPVLVTPTISNPTIATEIDLGTNSIGSTAQSSTGDGTTTIVWGSGNFFHFQFGAFNETFTFTAPTKPGTFILKLVQDSVGSRTATWPASVEWPGGTAPTLTTTLTTGTDIITFYYDGTDYFAVSSLDFQ